MFVRLFTLYTNERSVSTCFSQKREHSFDVLHFLCYNTQEHTFFRCNIFQNYIIRGDYFG